MMQGMLSRHSKRPAEVAMLKPYIWSLATIVKCEADDWSAVSHSTHHINQACTRDNKLPV